MRGELKVSRSRFLAFARKLALVSGCAATPLAACAGSGANVPPAGGGTSGEGSSTTSATNVATSTATETTPSDAPCRCSWDTNAAAAPRVCKKGEPNYDGTPCKPNHPSDEGGSYPYPAGSHYPMPVPGPLPPPDFPLHAFLG